MISQTELLSLSEKHDEQKRSRKYLGLILDDLIPCHLGESEIVWDSRSPEGSPAYYSRLFVATISALAFLNSTTLFAQGVSESSSAIAHPYIGLCVVALFGLGCRLTAAVADPELERLTLKALLDSLAAARISGKEAAILLCMSESQWTDICQGKRHTPTVTRLLNLPWPFWQAFLPSLAYVLTRKKVRDLVSDQQRRAS